MQKSHTAQNPKPQKDTKSRQILCSTVSLLDCMQTPLGFDNCQTACILLGQLMARQYTRINIVKTGAKLHYIITQQVTNSDP